MSDRLPSQPTEPPTVFAGDGSIVNTRDIKDLKGKGLVMHYKVCDPGAGPSENAVGQLPQAQYTATGRSVICAEKLSNVDVDGVIDLSVTMTPSQAHAGRAEETLPSCKGPAVEMITKHKVELIKYLMADHSFILQHVHAKQIITDKLYQNLMNISQPEQAITKLIDNVIFNGQESCSRFLEVLKKADVVTTYPQLKLVLSNSGTMHKP